MRTSGRGAGAVLRLRSAKLVGCFARTVTQRGWRRSTARRRCADGFPHGALDIGGFRGVLTIVRTDRPTIPRHGAVLNVQYTGSRHALRGRDQYEKLSASTPGVVSRGRQSFFLGLAGGPCS